MCQLNIRAADKLLFVAEFLGLSRSNVYELVDFYHAVEHLAKVADFKKNWTRSEKKRWIAKHRRLLLKGYSDKVIGAIKEICRGRNAKGITY